MHVAQFYAAEIVLVLESLHSRNIVYRDLKPENVLIAADGHLRLADFGFAKVVPDITWTFCGTPEYLAPELVSATGTGYGRAVDWYALGVLIYEMLFGKPPFYHENHLKLYDLIANQPVRFPESADPKAVDLMRGFFEKNPTRRLGVLKGGSQDVKDHPWFRNISWNLMNERQLRPPYRPKVSGPGDATNFDKFPEDNDPTVSEGEPDDYGRLFPEF
jgi:protein kinase A